MEKFTRTKMLIGQEALDKLKNSKIIIFGVGGVGGYVLEALVRSNVGYIEIVDNDDVNLSNINRQIIATTKTIGKPKVEVAKERMEEINPEVTIKPRKIFFSKENKDEFNLKSFDFIIDAIDSVSSKVELIKTAYDNKIPIISSMGMGNKLHPELIEIQDIYKTSVCPLARTLRGKLKKLGVKKLTTVFSKEMPIRDFNQENKRLPSSCAFVPSAAGLIMAGYVVRKIINLP